MKNDRRFWVPVLLGVLLLTGGCLLQSLGTLQTLVLFFQLTQAVPQGEAFEVHTSIYPNEVKLKGQFVRISGTLDPPPAATRVAVQAIGTDPVSGKQLHKFSTTVNIAADGSFSVVKKFNKNIAAGTVQTVTIEPGNGAIARDTRVGICVDITKKKGDFNDANSCATGPQPPDPNTKTHLVQVRDNAFSPKSIRISPGDKVRWELTGTDPSHTVTAMSGAFDSGFVFTSAGAFFERTFPRSEDGLTFEYSCTTHKACCQMQGSILVGTSAEPPDDGY